MLFVVSEGTAARRRFPVFLVSPTDGLTAVTTEAGGQPQISKNGGGFTNTTATLTAIGNGSYYVELSATELDTAGDVIVRYKSANTAEFSLSGDVLSVNIHDTVRMGMTALPNAAAEAAGGLYTRGTGAGQINQPTNGQVDTRTAAMATDVMTAAALAADFTVENNAPVLAVLGALANAASSGDPNTSNTIVQMLKQIVNTLEGTAGIPTWAAAAAPANAVSLAEAIRQIYTNVGLTATATALATVQADTDDIQTRLPAALVGGRMDSSVGAMAANVITAAATATDFSTEVNTGIATAAAVAALQTDTDDIQTRLPAALVSGRMDSSVGAMAANVMTAAAADPTLANEIADQVWDEVLSGHLTAGTTGAALNGAGGAGDPWGTAVPAAYGAGTAGYILGTNLNATVSSRATPSDVPTAIQNADALLGRDLASVVGAAARSPLNALRFLRNKWSVAAGTLTVTREDDTTTAWTAALTSDATAAPVTGSDPV